MKRYIKGLGLVALAGLVAAAFPAIKAAEAAEVVLYTASNPKIEKVMMAAFKKAHPDIKVSAVNLSTGPITEQAIAEKANPQADVIWMINGIALEQFR